MSSVQVPKPTPTPLMATSGLPPADDDTAGLLTPTTASADGARRLRGTDGDRTPVLVTIPLSLDVLIRFVMVVLIIVSSASQRHYPMRYQPINSPYGPIYRPIPSGRMPGVMIVVLTWNIVCLTLSAISLVLDLTKKSDAPWARHKWSFKFKFGSQTFKCLCGSEGDNDDGDDGDEDDNGSMDIVRYLAFVIELGMSIMFLVYVIRGGTQFTWPIFGLMIGNALAMPFTIAGTATIHYPWFWRPRRSVRLP